MTYSKEQFWQMSMDEARGIFLGHTVEAIYRGNRVRTGRVVNIIGASNDLNLPFTLQLENSSSSIHVVENELLSVRILR